MMGNPIVDNYSGSRQLSKKQFELTNHLGNVLATVTDKKIPVDADLDGNIDFYQPDIISMQDYYPFGMLMPNRNFTPENYRFGFNGQEKTDEISGEGNHNTALYWEYDTRLGRRWNLDPKPTIGLSDYSALGDNAIWHNDPFGDKFKLGVGDAQAQVDMRDAVRNKNKKYLNFNNGTGEVTLNFGNKSQNKIERLIRKDIGLSTINDLVNAKDASGKDVTFFYGTDRRNINAINRITGNVLNPPISFPGGAPGTTSYGKDYFLNLSITDRNPNENYPLPEAGYQGQVFIAQGALFSLQPQTTTNYGLGNQVITTTKNVPQEVPRSYLVLHELRENYFRTMGPLDYNQAHNKAGGPSILNQIDYFIYK